MASNEDPVREDRREKDRFKKTAEVRDARLKLTSQLHVRVKLCYIDWPDAKIMIGVDVLL